MTMKCTIIQDLLPLYCDGLTSPDSNEEIEKHLTECEKCREVYDNMKAKEMNISIPERDVKPLKAVKKRNIAKIAAAVLGTAAVLFGLFMFVFWGVVPISSDRVHYTVEAHESQREYQYSEDAESPEDENAEWETKTETVQSLWLKFDTDANCCRFSTKPEYIYNDDGSITVHDHLYIYPQVKMPFDNRGDNPEQFGLGLDAHKGDTLTIHYLDKEEVIDVYKLYEENVK
ncbi:MAG: zf-HC2 domain-containing protein [Ruminococcus sp.]|nr:zf-HC2 domain-containing protein [Ruminococcus sp.]